MITKDAIEQCSSREDAMASAACEGDQMHSHNNIVDGLVLDLQCGCGLILLSVAFFQILSAAVHILPLPKTVSQQPLDEFRVFRWRNLLVSWMHGGITGTSCILCLYYYGDSMWNNMMEWVSVPGYVICSFSAGYFVYDSLDIVKHRRIKEKWEILVHHGAIVASALYPLASLQAVGYHVLAMSIEMNTAFLHTRTIMLMSGVPRNSAPVRIAMILNILSFVLFRFVPLYYETEAIFLHYWRVPAWFVIQFSCSMIVLNVINLILFYRILKTDFFRASTSLNRRYFGGVEEESKAGQVNGAANGKPSDPSNGPRGGGTGGGSTPSANQDHFGQSGAERPGRHKGSDGPTKNLCDSLDLDEEAKLPKPTVSGDDRRATDHLHDPPINKQPDENRKIRSESPNSLRRLNGSVRWGVDEQIVQVSRSLNLRM